MDMALSALLAQQPPPPHDWLTGGLGVAAVVFVLGWAATRWQRDRMRFELMKAALEKGVTRFPGTPPYWLISLRLGVTLVVLGLGLSAMGTAAWWLGRGVAMPTSASTAVHTSQPPSPGDAASSARSAGGASASAGHDERAMDEPPPPPPPPGGPEERENGEPGPREWHEARRNHAGPPPRDEREHSHPAPPPRDPEVERWHRAQAQQTFGLVGAGVGFILFLLGIVRIGFARIEQRFTTESDDAVM